MSLYSSSNFLVPSSSEDTMIQIRDQGGDIKFTINPCEVRRTYISTVYLRIQTLNNLISLKFLTEVDVALALALLDDRIDIIKENFPCDEVVVSDTTPIFAYSSFIVPVSSADTKIQLRDVSGVIRFSVDPCSVDTIYTSTIYLKIKMVIDILTLRFASVDEASSAMSALSAKVVEMEQSLPCSEDTTIPVTIFNLSNFLAPSSSTDKKIHIRDPLNVIKYTIDPCNVSSVYDEFPYVKIQTTSNIISLKFDTESDAASAVTLLQDRIDSIKLSFPCPEISTPTVVASPTYSFNSSNFLVPLGSTDRNVQIRDINNSIRYIIEPCNVTVTYAKYNTPYLIIKLFSGDPQILMKFESAAGALSALTKLQTGIDYIKSNFPCREEYSGFTYVQSYDSTDWVIEHNLGRRPTVIVMDSNYEEIEALVQNTTLNITHVYFNEGMTGSAYLI